MASTPFIADLVGAQLKASSGQSGLTGLAAGLIFKRAWQRSPMLALSLGGAYIVFQGIKAAKQAKARQVIREERPGGAVAAARAEQPDVLNGPAAGTPVARLNALGVTAAD